MEKKEKDFLYFWAEGQKIPQEDLDKWREDPNHWYHCVFCSTHYQERDFPNSFHACMRCKEYKGINPCLDYEEGHCSLDA